MTLLQELEWAIHLAEEAGEVIRNARESGFQESRKADKSVVTSADFASDQLLRDGIRTRRPMDALLTEEAGWFPGQAGARTWVVDPLDGTRAFTMGHEGVSVLLGLIDGEMPVFGVAHFPFEGVTYWAARGEGAFKKNSGESEGRRIPPLMSGTPGTLALSPSTPAEQRARLLRGTGLQSGPLLHGAGAKFMCLVDGRASAYFSGHGLSYWDTTGPGVILDELGCEVTSDRGKPLLYAMGERDWKHEGGIVASVGLPHEEVVRGIQLALEDGNS